jgi:peptide/nickel transport system permease protein
MRRLPLSVVMLLGWAVLALAAPWFDLHPDRIDLTHILTPPGSTALLGFDDLGRPVWYRLVMGARSSLLAAVVSLSALLGVAVGVSSAYLGGAWDRCAMRVIDIVLAFPGILLAIALAGVLGPGLDNVVIALCSVGWVGYARLARAQVLALKHRDHVLAARALGAGQLRIMTRHLLPLIAAPLIVEASFSIAAVVLAEAGLSFLGLGIQPPAASWGSMIRDGTRYMLVAPHMVLAPGLALLLVVLAVNLLGDRLRDRLDVRGRG